MTKKIAVLMAAYNGEEYINCQIDSIFNQQCKYHISLFVRNDGSTDRTADIVREYAEKNYDIHLIDGENIGSNGSFFTLVEYAKTLPEEYVYFSFADQDDRWDPDKLQIAADTLERQKEQNIPLLYGASSRHVDKNLSPMKNVTHKPMDIELYNSIIQTFMPGHTYLFNRELLNELRDIDLSRIYVHDSFVLNAAVICGKVIYDPTMHVDYRQHGNNQLGAENSKLQLGSWIKNRVKRIKRGDNKKYAKQIIYIHEKYKDRMNKEQECEIRKFIDSRKNFFKRLKYIFVTKLHRR